MKCEPKAYNIDDLSRAPDKTTHWEGVRNYQVRNMLRDEIKEGDRAFFYYSNAKEPGVVGIMKIVKSGYPDFCAWDPENRYYDPDSTPENPRWYMVDVQLVKKFDTIVLLSALRANPLLQNMWILRKGNRLSITPVTETEWKEILYMAGT